MFNNNSCSQRSSMSINDSLRSFTTGSSRILSPIAFFHDGIPINDMTLGHNMIGTHRRAQAIATAPRRNRYEDDDNDHGSNNTRFHFAKTTSVPIPTPSVIPQQTQSLPKIESDVTLIPNFRDDSPRRYTTYDFSYLCDNKSSSNQYSSESLP